MVGDYSWEDWRQWRKNDDNADLSTKRALDVNAPLDKPVLAYAGGSGHAWDSDSSFDRERANDRSGKTLGVQQAILDTLRNAPDGMTWNEIDYEANIDHHGLTSGALTALRKAGHIFWLKEKRDGCHPFVHKSWRDRHPDDTILFDAPPRANRLEAAEGVCRALVTYMTSHEPEAWSEVVDRLRVWEPH